MGFSLNLVCFAVVVIVVVVVVVVVGVVVIIVVVVVIIVVVVGVFDVIVVVVVLSSSYIPNQTHPFFPSFSSGCIFRPIISQKQKVNGKAVFSSIKLTGATIHGQSKSY